MKAAGLQPLNNHQPVVPSHDGMHVVATAPVRRGSAVMLRLHKLKLYESVLEKQRSAASFFHRVPEDVIMSETVKRKSR